ERGAEQGTVAAARDGSGDAGDHGVLGAGLRVSQSGRADGSGAAGGAAVPEQQAAGGTGRIGAGGRSGRADASGHVSAERVPGAAGVDAGGKQLEEHDAAESQ